MGSKVAGSFGMSRQVWDLNLATPESEFLKANRMKPATDLSAVSLQKLRISLGKKETL